MKKNKLTKVIASSLLVASMLGLYPIEANAEWKQDSNGWWNTEGVSWSVGWKQIDGKWYYFGQDGYMVHDTTIGGYQLGSDGAWIQSAQNSLTSNTDKALTSNDTNFNIDELVNILKTKFNNIVSKDVGEDFLTATRKLITIDNEILTIYIYNNNQEMEKDATNLINNNGSYEKNLGNGEAEVICPDWSYAPHFYKKGKLIVQYCGENETILSNLKDIFGEQFIENEESNDKQDVRKIAFNQLSEQEKKSIKGTWKDAKVSTIILEESMGNITNKAYVGKEVYSISFTINANQVPNNIIVYMGMDNNKLIGYGYTE